VRSKEKKQNSKSQGIRSKGEGVERAKLQEKKIKKNIGYRQIINILNLLELKMKLQLQTLGTCNFRH
jgi:hypothetical protein